MMYKIYIYYFVALLLIFYATNYKTKDDYKIKFLTKEWFVVIIMKLIAALFLTLTI